MQLTRFQQWIGAWHTLLDGLCAVATFGYWYPGLYLNYYRRKLGEHTKV